MPEERPIKLVVDLEAKEQGEEDYAQYVPLTDEEMKQRAKDQADAEKRAEAERVAEEERERALDRLKANPEFSDLLKVLNL